MSERRTYTERRSYSAQVMKWRLAVYQHNGLTNSCKILMLRLSDDMDAKCIVSVPRNVLADDLRVAPARISEGIKQARKVGFLDIVRRGRPGVTATYHGTFATRADADKGTPQRTSESDTDNEEGYAHTYQEGVRLGVPQNGSEGYAPDPTQEVVETEAIEQAQPNENSDGAGDESAYLRSLSLAAALAYATDCPHGIPDDSRFPACPDCLLIDDELNNARRWPA